MKRISSSGLNLRFKGGSRYAHNPRARRSAWDQWVDGVAKPSRPITKWLKILGFIVFIAALGGIIAGLTLVLGHH